MKRAEESRRKTETGEDNKAPQRNLWQRILHFGK